MEMLVRYLLTYTQATKFEDSAEPSEAGEALTIALANLARRNLRNRRGDYRCSVAVTTRACGAFAAVVPEPDRKCHQISQPGSHPCRAHHRRTTGIILGFRRLRQGYRHRLGIQGENLWAI